MFAALFTIATLVLSAFADDELSINTPTAVSTCQEVVITWQKGTPPYNLAVVPGDDPCDAALAEFPSTNDTWFHWEAPNLAAGTQIVFALEDATGDEVWSGELTIKAGSTTSCNSTASSAAGSGTTLVIPAAETAPASASPSSPVVNPGTGSGLSGAAPSSKGGLTVAGAGFVALLSVLFAL